MGSFVLSPDPRVDTPGALEITRNQDSVSSYDIPREVTIAATFYG